MLCFIVTKLQWHRVLNPQSIIVWSWTHTYHSLRRYHYYSLNIMIPSRKLNYDLGIAYKFLRRSHSIIPDVGPVPDADIITFRSYRNTHHFVITTSSTLLFLWCCYRIATFRIVIGRIIVFWYLTRTLLHSGRIVTLIILLSQHHQHFFLRVVIATSSTLSSSCSLPTGKAKIPPLDVAINGGCISILTVNINNTISACLSRSKGNDQISNEILPQHEHIIIVLIGPVHSL